MSPVRLSLSVQIAAGLLAGLALGLIASATRFDPLLQIATGIEPAGTIWINAIRMCVVPLVVTALISGVAALGDPRRLGRVGARTFAFVFGTLLLAELLGLALSLVTIPLAPVSEQTAASLRAAAAAGAEQISQQAGRVHGLRQFIVDLVPPNPVRAAADGQLLPLIVFSVLVGAAIGSLQEESRRSLTQITDSLVAALIKLIGWVMRLAPVGVACLAAPVAARFGWEAVRSLAVFVVTVVAGTVIFATAAYAPLAKWLGGVRIAPFARAITPGTTVAFTTASSMAALPTMMDSALNTLKISNPIASFVLPLGATLNRPGSAVYQMCAVVLVASLYGVTLGPVEYVTALATCLLMTFSVAAIPSATVFTTAPVLLSVGLPVESLALLLGVDRIPDMFRTGLNAIGHQVAAVVIARSEGETPG